MAIKKGLGKGLDSMIPEKKDSEKTEIQSGGGLIEVAISQIDTNADQPRKRFDEDELLELSESIRLHGVIQPIILTARGKRYEIIAGERRFRAAKLAGLTKIPAVIREYTEREIMEVSLIENIQRQDLNPIEEAKAYQNLIKEYKLKQDDLAERLSKSRSSITNALRLLKLSDKVQSMLEENIISGGHARALLAIEDKDRQQALAMRIFDEKLSVREVEKLVKKLSEAKEEPEKKSGSEESAYKNIEENLKTILGSKVVIKGKSGNRGKIEIDYYSVDELERLIELFSGIKR